MPQTPCPRAALRRALAERRRQLPPAERLAAGAAVAALLSPLALLTEARRVAIYWSVRGELPLLMLTRELLARDQAIYLPIVQDDGSLRFGAWRPGAALTGNRFGIPEPELAAEVTLSGAELDLVLVPLLAFDRQGHRLGSGAGYYDRSFAFLRERPRPSRPLLLGVAYAWQEQPSLPAEPWDVTLDAIVCEHELITVHKEPWARHR